MSRPGPIDGGGPRRGGALTASPGTLPAPARPWPTRLELDARPTSETHGGGLHIIASYWRVLVKHRWTIIAVVVAALAMGVAATLLTRPIYTAAATLQIDREAEKVVSAEDQTPADNLGEEFFQTQYGLLRSRALAARVVESLGLARDDRFREAMTVKRHAAGGRSDDAQGRRGDAIDLVQAGEGVAPERGSRLVDVTFSSPDPDLSARVANAFAENFIASAIDRRFESSSYARDFLEKRLAQVKAKLEQSERDLVAYAASQQIIQLTNAGQPNGANAGPSLPAADLESFNTALAAAKTDRIRAEQRWREAEGASGVGLADILQSPTVQVLSQEHAKLVADYQDKLSVFKPSYPDMLQLKARIAETQRQLDIEAANIRESLRTQYEAALANERALSAQVEGLKTSVLDLRGRSIRYTILQREVDTNRTLYDGLLQRYKEVGVAGGVSSNNISIVDRAEAPQAPSRPRPLVNMAVAGLGGLVMGVLIAFVREGFDQAVRAPADLETRLGLPLLGTIPSLKKGVTPREALADTRSPLAEAYHSLRSALQFSTADGFPKTLLVTSPWPGGGKSTTAFAIAQYVARLGFRVLLIDADLRSPSLQTIVGAENRVGLTNLLTGATILKDTVQPTDLANLFVITSGPPPPNPAELLAGARLQLLIAEANAVFDMVIFDGPPVMGLADAPMIGAAVAGALLVVEASRTSRSQVQAALRRLDLAGAHVLGAVLTRYNGAHATDGYGYGYGYGYGSVYGYGHGDHDHDTQSEGRRRRLPAVVARARRLISH